MRLGFSSSFMLITVVLTATAQAEPAAFPRLSSQSSDAPTGPHPGVPFEVSPTVGFMGGSALLGVRASMGSPVSIELSAEQVIGRAATLYPLTFNLAYDLNLDSRAIPYGIV